MVRPDFDAVLHHWSLIQHDLEQNVRFSVLGMVSGDRRGRFDDERWIQTSLLLTPLDDVREGAVIQTLNSRYFLSKPLRLETGDAERLH